MTRSFTGSTARPFSAASTSLRSALHASALSFRIAVVMITIVAMAATALVFGKHTTAAATESVTPEPTTTDATSEVMLDDADLDDGDLDDNDLIAADLIDAQSTPATYSTHKSARNSADNEMRAVTAKVLLAREMKVVRSRIVEIARKQIGDSYIPGASGPHGFDCSGLTRFVYEHAADISLPHYSRAQYGKVKKVSRANAQPGDLVFFFESGAHHVGIYIGNGKMIDAPGRGDKVRVSPTTGSWWGRTFTGMGRILPA
jgi:cell wall-associated NlpC family hydrolase